MSAKYGCPMCSYQFIVMHSVEAIRFITEGDTWAYEPIDGLQEAFSFKCPRCGLEFTNPQKYEVDDEN